MAEMQRATKTDLEAKVIELLDDNRVMTLATNRPDGWPQATMVGYVREGLDLYFVVGRRSQKLANIARDPRVSIAIGRLSIAIGELRDDRILGLSMAARAEELVDVGEIVRLNDLVEQRYPEAAVFAPREASVAVIRARPQIISIIDLPMGAGRPVDVAVDSAGQLQPLAASAAAT